MYSLLKRLIASITTEIRKCDKKLERIKDGGGPEDT